MVALLRSAIVSCLLTSSSYAFAVKPPPSFVGRNTVVMMSAGGQAAIPEVKVKNEKPLHESNFQKDSIHFTLDFLCI